MSAAEEFKYELFTVNAERASSWKPGWTGKYGVAGRRLRGHPVCAESLPKLAAS